MRASCPKCGKQIEIGVPKCPSCGATFRWPESVIITANAERAKEREKKKQEAAEFDPFQNSQSKVPVNKFNPTNLFTTLYPLWAIIFGFIPFTGFIIGKVVRHRNENDSEASFCAKRLMLINGVITGVYLTLFLVNICTYTYFRSKS